MSAKDHLAAYELALQLISDHHWQMTSQEMAEVANRGLDGDLEWLQEWEA